MSISSEVALILKGQNVATPSIAEVTASLKDMRTNVRSLTTALGAYNTRLTSTISLNRDASVSFDGLAVSVRATADAYAQLAIAQRATQTVGIANTVAGASVRQSVAGTVSRDTGLAVRAGGAGLTQSGGFALGGVSGGAGVLGSATIPAVVAAIVGYLGFKSVNVANEFNQSVRDVIASSSQNLSQVPIISQGILNLAGGQNRFTPQQIQAAQYAVQSTPLFANSPKLALNALATISQQGQPYGAAALPALATADTGAFNAFHLSNQGQFARVANIIARGVNVGAAEPADFAKGIGTFAASGYAAGLTGTTGLAQLAGAFAQGSILSPRFRFDAQGLNSLLQQVNGKQTAGAASVESNLGISGLFGVGAIGKAGGLPQWLTALQNATGALGPDQQQQFLQSIFTRQNSLQAIRGLTGQNFGTAQDRIAQVQNYAGTVSTGARIADTGPQAQFDQIRSQFNKDVIEIGDTISKTLTPDLALLGTNVLKAAGKMGDFLGVVGTGIDKLSRLLDLPVNVPKVAGDIDHTVPGGKGTIAAAVFGPLGLFVAGAKGLFDNVVAPSGVGKATASLLNTPLPFGRAYPAPASPVLGTSYSPAGTYSASWYSDMGLNPNAQGNHVGFKPGTYTAPISNATPGVESIFPLRSITGGTASESGGPVLALGSVAGQAGTAVGSLVQHLVTFADGIGAVSRAVTATNALNATKGVTPGQQLTLDRGSLQYQLSVGASNSTLNAAVAKVKADLGLSGKSPTEQRNLLEQYTKPVTAIENQRIVNSANTRYGALQDQLTYDKLKNLPTSQDIKSLTDFITANRKALGLDPLQAQIAVLQMQQSTASAVVKALPPQLIRPTNLGAGGVYSADFGGAVASLAGGKGQNNVVARLERQIAQQAETIQLLRSELGLSKSSDASLKSIAATSAVVAKNSAPQPSKASRADMLRSVQAHR